MSEVGTALRPHLAAQPGPRIGPHAFRSSWRYGQERCSVLDRHPREHAQLDEFRGGWVHRAELRQCAIEVDEVVDAGMSADGQFNEVATLAVPATLGRPSETCLLHQDSTHCLGCCTEEMPAAIPLLDFIRAD